MIEEKIEVNIDESDTKWYRYGLNVNILFDKNKSRLYLCDPSSMIIILFVHAG